VDSNAIFERESAMRRTEANGRTRQNSSIITMRACGLAVLSLSLGLVVATTARAGDDDRTFSEKIMDGFYGTIRGTNMDNRGIDYRERSPLVVPPTLDLPPPASADAQVANWPKDPDERQRKAVIAAKKKAAPPPTRVLVTTAGAVQAQPINIAPPVDPQAGTPPVPGTTRPAYASDRNGTALTDPVYDKPGDLFTGGAADLADSIGIGNWFGGGSSSKPVQVEPGTEPARQALTQPPVGYQTVSPNYAYGEEKKGWLDGTANPDRNPQSQMSSASSVVH
jgi:hypothetical protein